jgi:2-polyprenyl-6-methoxyphenol hydroxylase-like FAD-dependent oxidoreductase
MLADLTIPDPGFKSRLCQLLADTPWTWGGSWVACSQLHGPRAVLLGDAAHACSPSLGQGCNCALEDVTVLDEVGGC